MDPSIELRRAIQRVSDFRQDLADTAAAKVDVLEQERLVQEIANQIGCELMREVLKRADVDAPEIKVNGVRWGNRREIETTYTTKFGDVRVARGVYSRSGGGPVLVPLELRLGLVEGRYTPAVARVMTRARASMPAVDSEALLKEAGIAMVSSSTLHRVPKAMAARYETMREQIIEEVRQSEAVPDAAIGVQVALDGVMVPQDGELAKPRGRKTDSPKAPRHETRYGPVNGHGPANDDGQTGRSWHEGSVGTLAYFDKEGNRLRTVYIARMPEAKMFTLADELEGELMHALSQRPDLDISFASDGDHHQWELLEGMVMRLPHTATGMVYMLLDFFHGAEYLGEAAALVYGADTADAHASAAQWCEILKHAEAGADRVLKSLRYHRDEMRKGSKRERMQEIIDYLANNNKSGRLNYAEALAANKPIGTGITEAAAKTVVNVPMKRAGARFEQHGGQTVMTFRAAMLSDRFERLSRLLELSYTARIDVQRAA